MKKYIVQEVQHIYASQGQTINDKHLEIIVRKMFSKVRIIDGGDTQYFAGEVAERADVEKLNVSMEDEKKTPATYEQLLLGITRAALATNSWLAGASFQETIRVLVEAAVIRKIDTLQGLKENVIIGRLIPTGDIFKERFADELAGKKT